VICLHAPSQGHASLCQGGWRDAINELRTDQFSIVYKKAYKPEFALPTGPPLNPSVNPCNISLSPPGPATSYPRLTKLADGSILAGYTETEGQHRALKVTRSTDGGMTFAP